jgi:transposase
MTQEEELRQLREENAALRAENQELCQRVTEMETQLKQIGERLAKDSHNSHLPPSSDRFARQKKTKSLRKKSEKKRGGQAGHEGTTLYQASEPDQIIVHAVEMCDSCQADISLVPAQAIERRQILDLPPKHVVVIEHQGQHKICPHCQAVTKAAFPAGVSAPVQYGPAFGAVGVYLTQQQFLPYERACETIQDLIGPAMSVGTLKTLVERCAVTLKPIEEQIKEHLRTADVLHQDETGTYVMGKRLWVHVAATKQVTHYAVHAKRGQKALESIGILPQFTGISVHDGWAIYWKYTTCQHALCNVHHQRELIFLHEEQQQAWAGEMNALLSALHAAVKQAREQGRKQLDPTEVADWKTQYQTLLQEGYQANPPDPPPVAGTGKRGRRKQSAARNLLDRLSKHQEAVLRFLECFAVPFDNSQAERDIRMVKVQQKISGGFRSLPGAEAFFRIRSYLSTLRKQGAPVLTALELALAGHPLSPAFSSFSS